MNPAKKAKLNYNDVYVAYRSIFPRFGSDDSKNFIELLKLKGYDYFVDSNEENKLKKVYFCSQMMRDNLSLYGYYFDRFYLKNKYL